MDAAAASITIQEGAVLLGEDPDLLVSPWVMLGVGTVTHLLGC